APPLAPDPRDRPQADDGAVLGIDEDGSDRSRGLTPFPQDGAGPAAQEATPCRVRPWQGSDPCHGRFGRLSRPSAARAEHEQVLALVLTQAFAVARSVEVEPRLVELLAPLVVERVDE